MGAPPLVWGIYALALVSILFEPVRNSLHGLGQSVGGVGGVGGLTNQWGPARNCSTTTGGYHAPWCFQPGRLGFTPYAGVVLLLCTLPLTLAAVAAYATARVREVRSLARTGGEEDEERLVTALSVLWYTMSVLWFAVPLCAYLASPFYQQDFWHIVCGVAICAAFPLSWHLSFVAMPASMAPFLAPMLGIKEAVLKRLHKRIAWATVGWAALHISGEVSYLLSQGQFVSNVTLKLPAWEDSLVFVFGVSTAGVLCAHTALALARRHTNVRSTFRRNHRILAAVLLLSATAHWWPFAFFLAPAIACTATGLAVRAAKENAEGRSEAAVQRDAPLALACSLVATVLGITAVWALRQDFMLNWRPGDFQTPFVFPPAAVAVAYICARAVATTVLWARATKHAADVRNLSTPLLSDGHGSLNDC